MKLAKILKEILSESKLNSNFKSWFGNSKIVKSGKPTVMYHGTSNKFDKFDSSKKVNGWLSKGFYFTEDKNEVSTYGSITLSVYLSIKNPFIIKDDVANPDGTVEWAKDKKDQIFEILPEARDIPWGDVSDLLEKKGYDGFVWGNWATCFNPNQIKSIKNNGDWSTGNLNIYE